MNNKPTHVKPSLYAYYFLQLKEIALKYGYNLVLHGSLNRDLDLIAIPWQEEIKPHTEMIEEFAIAIGGTILMQDQTQENREGNLYGLLPQGRLSYVININRGGERNNYIDQQYYLDVSVTPSV